MSWHNNIFDYNLSIIELKILKKLRTASLNSKFTDIHKKYKKAIYCRLFSQDFKHLYLATCYIKSKD